jgi:hypothetical protein
MALPRELRDHILRHILVKHSSDFMQHTWQPGGLRHTFCTSSGKRVLVVLRLNKQINIEAREMLYGEYEFENFPRQSSPNPFRERREQSDQQQRRL